jgi:hypothetical protein
MISVDIVQKEIVGLRCVSLVKGAAVKLSNLTTQERVEKTACAENAGM